VDCEKAPVAMICQSARDILRRIVNAE